MSQEDNRLVVTFRADKIKDDAASKKAGRPIFRDIELCEIRTAGDRNTVKVFPAHSFHRWTTNLDGDSERETYAQRWNEQYRRFKERRDQIQEGTPLSELPFLTEAKRAELKALSVHTAETLAALDGQNLKTLGMGGRELKNQAQAYLDNAAGNADVTQMAQTIAELQAQIASLMAGQAAPAVDGAGDPPVGWIGEPATEPSLQQGNAAAPADDDTALFEDASVEELKEYITSQTGSRPRGNPNHETLVRMAREASQQVAA